MAVLLAVNPPALARPISDPVDPSDQPGNAPQRGVRIADSSPGYSVFDNGQTSVTIGASTTQTLGWFTNFFTGTRDLGDWFCAACSVSTAADPTAWTSFITSVVNPMLGDGPNGRWILENKIAVCGGSETCVILTFHGYVSDAWFPDPRQGPVTKKDKGKYKNPSDTPPTKGPAANNSATPFFGSNGNVLLWLLSSGPAPSTGGTLVVKVGPLEVIPTETPVPLPGINNTTDPGNFGGDGQGTVVALTVELTGAGKVQPGLVVLGHCLAQQCTLGVARVVEFGFSRLHYCTNAQYFAEIIGNSKSQSPSLYQFGLCQVGLALGGWLICAPAAHPCNYHAQSLPPYQCSPPESGAGELSCRYPPRQPPSQSPAQSLQSCRHMRADHAAAQNLAVATRFGAIVKQQLGDPFVAAIGYGAA